jgi:hypothetical protein
MDVLKITPPFFYSYQCGSTLLTSYLPVHMYSISLQVLYTILTLIIIFSSSSSERHPPWLLSSFPKVCWPYHGQHVERGSSALDLKRPVMIKPHQIISKTMGNIILLLSFGLCSPVLCVSIAVSICLHLCSWLMLIGRFVCVRIEIRPTSASTSPSIDEAGLLFSLAFLAFPPFDVIWHSLTHSLQKHRMKMTRPSSTTRSSISWTSSSRASIPLSWSPSGRWLSCLASS